MKLIYYLFNEIPGTHHTWMLAVLAIGERDARDYVKAHFHGGRLAQVIDTPGAHVKADCGAVTSRAADYLAHKNL